MLVLWGLAVALLPIGNHGVVTQIDNTQPRTDQSGNIIDAHDGTIVQWKPQGLYYYYAVAYGPCLDTGAPCDRCNQTKDQTGVGIWTNRYLAQDQWHWQGWLFPNNTHRPAEVLIRPHAVYNNRTRLYVLWLNAMGQGPCPAGSANKCYITMTSPHPEGPFGDVVVAHTKYTAQGGVGDFDVFTDDDGTGYLIHKRSGAATQDPHRMLIEQLTDDYRHSTNATLGVFGQQRVEAPVMFKRNGTYFAMFGSLCCFCPLGSGINVYTASRPLGPYTLQGNVGCQASVPVGCTCNNTRGYIPPPSRTCPSVPPVTQAQQNVIVKVPSSNGTTTLLWTGDRWQSSPDGIRGHALQYWDILQWDPQGLPRQFEWHDQVVFLVD
eukprot:m.291442 g.291442  ORF g.291442 m.291442 type:complete len:378 (-) comp17816_c0_seq6:185-1318(-)